MAYLASWEIELSIILEFLNIRSFMALAVKTYSQEFFKERFPKFVVSVASNTANFSFVTDSQVDVPQLVVLNLNTFATLQVY